MVSNEDGSDTRSAGGSDAEIDLLPKEVVTRSLTAEELERLEVLKGARIPIRILRPFGFDTLPASNSGDDDDSADNDQDNAEEIDL